jgi:hypothetical protein
MTRSLLRPIRTRRVRHATVTPEDFAPASPSAGTRRTVAAIGALWLSFAVTSASQFAAKPSASAPDLPADDPDLKPLVQ